MVFHFRDDGFRPRIPAFSHQSPFDLFDTFCLSVISFSFPRIFTALNVFVDLLCGFCARRRTAQYILGRVCAFILSASVIGFSGSSEEFAENRQLDREIPTVFSSLAEFS